MKTKVFRIGSVVVLFVALVALVAVGLRSVVMARERTQHGMVTLAFDDGWQSQYDVAVPMLDTAGFKGTFYIITDTLVPGKYKDYMTSEEVKDLYAKGQEIGAHTVHHIDLTATSTDIAQREIVDSKQVLESLLNAPVVSFAYPYGRHNDVIMALVKNAGFENARGAGGHSNATGAPLYELASYSPESDTSLQDMKHAIDDAEKNNTWAILVFHEFNDNKSGRTYSDTSQYLQQIVDYISSKGMQVVTVRDGVSRLQAGDLTKPKNVSMSASVIESMKEVLGWK